MKKKKTLQILKRIFILGLVLILPINTLAVPANAAETVTTPALSVTARSTEFNEDWQFYLGNPEGAERNDYDDSAWRTLNLPHDWSIEQDFTTDVAPEIAHLPGGTGWYRKTIVLPTEMAGKRIRIDFGGVYMDSTTYVNGQMVGNYPYGYSPFSYDITDYLVCDGVTENVIAVKVVNSTSPGAESSRWYSGSGIYRDVNLIVTDPVHVTTYGSVVTTPNLEQEYPSGNVTVNAKTTVKNDGSRSASVVVRNSILNYYDDTVFVDPVSSGAQTVPAGGTITVSQDLTARNPKLWSVDSPNLYKMRTEILLDGEVVDTYDARFGFRWFKLDPNDGFSLNGEYMKLHGVCLHHDQGALGAVANEAAISRQLSIMKEMGANAVRLTHNPASEAMLKQCDEQGMLAIEEAFDTWYRGKNGNDYGRFFEKVSTHPEANGVTWAQYDIQQMVRRGINYPSIILWSIGNEIYESGESKGITTGENLIKWVKEIDNTRGTTIGSDKMRGSASGSDGTAYMEIHKQLDLIGFNYDSAARYVEYHNYYPDECFYGSETSSALKSRGYYSDPQKKSGASDPVQYQISSYENAVVSWGFSATDSIKGDRDNKFIAGQFVWTGFDYLGEPTPYYGMTSLPKSSYFGLVDTAGFAKDEYYLYQSQWLDADTDPMVHILPHWNWEDDNLRSKVTVDGKIPVRVYTNAPTVELFMDGVSLGEKSFAVKTTNYGMTYYENADNGMLYLEWPIAYNYKPGTEIVAVAKDASGNEIARDRIVTAGDTTGVNVTVDRQVITADGKDLAYITVDMVDAEGNFVPTAMNQLYFSIEGNGEIVGVDNGNAASWERYKDTDGVWKRQAFNGKALVIVQSTKEAGSFTLTASGAGLKSDSITVYTKAADADDDTLLGYEIPSVTINAGDELTLPETVTAIYSDGSTAPVSVTWDAVTVPNTAAEMTVNGITANGDPVKLNLTVRSRVGILDTSIVTGINQMPTLPDTVTAIWSDGLLEEAPVTWPSISADQLSQAGLFEITGTVSSLDMSATAKIHVKEEQNDIRISTPEYGTTATATYEESNGNHPVRQINDGIIDNSNGYGNWNSTHRLSDQVTLNFTKEYEISRITAWLTSMNTWQTPDTITIEYWDGSYYIPVSNQSKTTGFTSRANSTQVYNGENITFDPVTTARLRITFSVNSYNSGKDMMKITEVEVFTSAILGDSDATLKSIEVDGTPLEGFDPQTNVYTVELPYGADVPQVTAAANGYATVFVRQALTNTGAAQIRVASEDGSTVQNYTVQFMLLPPTLKTVTLSAASTDITEDDYVPLTIEGILADGSALDLNKASVSYDVTDITGHAQISRGELVAYDEGDVEVTATVEYLGEKVTSNTLTFHIAKNTKPKELISLTAESVYTNLNTAPALPETVTAVFEYGPNRELKVTWETVSADQLSKYGSFTVTGTVEGYSMKAEVLVIVRDAWALEQISLATTRGVVPELPATLPAYYSDLSSETVAVTWQSVTESDFDLEVGSIVKVTGTAKLDGTTLTTTASVRISEGVKSANYVLQRNGYQLPIALSSYTNDNVVNNNSGDRLYYINDGEISFVMGGGKHIWCNWYNGTQRPTEWVGAVIANEGRRVEWYVDTVSVGFCAESATELLQLPQEYYVEYYTGPSDYTIDEATCGHVESWANSPLNDSANWKEVDYISKPSAASLSSTSMTTITFTPVKTGLVRVRMIAQDGKCLGITEFEVYGKYAQTNTSYSVSEIALDGTNMLSAFEQNGNEYTLDIQTNDLPEITVSATDNAQVNILQPAENPGKAIVTILPENGDELQKRTYTINFEPVAEPVIGDINSSGAVNIFDAIRCMELILTGDWNSLELQLGDLNHNNILDAADIILIRNIILGA